MRTMNELSMECSLMSFVSDVLNHASQLLLSIKHCMNLVNTIIFCIEHKNILLNIYRCLLYAIQLRCMKSIVL